MQQNTSTETSKERLSRALYTTIMLILVLCNWCAWLIKAPFKGADYSIRKRQRLGQTPELESSGGLLVHCVSVGEVVVAASLIKRIRSIQPDYPVTVTTTTATGAQQVKDLFADTVSHCYLPYDLPWLARHLINRVKPEKVLVTEVELWPNFIHACYSKHLPVYLINARMTDKSAQRYAKLGILFNAMLNKLTKVCAQGQRDYKNYLALGLNEQQLLLSNNIKFDLELSQQETDQAAKLAALLQIENRTVLLGASTHDPEEKVLLQSYQQLKKDNPNLLLILTPRHPQRFAKVEKLIAQQPLAYQCLSQQTQIKQETDVLLVDAMGVLKSVYSLADIAFVGGSLADRGGHNALEAALLSKPILMGPSQHNNPAICDALIQAGALQTVEQENELTDKIRFWLANPKVAVTAGSAGARVISDNAGAINSTLKAIGF